VLKRAGHGTALHRCGVLSAARSRTDDTTLRAAYASCIPNSAPYLVRSASGSIRVATVSKRRAARLPRFPDLRPGGTAHRQREQIWGLPRFGDRLDDHSASYAGRCGQWGEVGERERPAQPGKLVVAGPWLPTHEPAVLPGGKVHKWWCASITTAWWTLADDAEAPTVPLLEGPRFLAGFTRWAGIGAP
jgi:hypothetical protein